MKERRLRQIKLRKNFLPTLIVDLILWALLAVLIFFVSPSVFWAKPAFFVVLFMALFLLSSLVFANSRRGFVVALAIVIFSALRILGVGNILNLILLVGIAIAFEIFFVYH